MTQIRSWQKEHSPSLSDASDFRPDPVPLLTFIVSVAVLAALIEVLLVSRCRLAARRILGADLTQFH